MPSRAPPPRTRRYHGPVLDSPPDDRQEAPSPDLPAPLARWLASGWGLRGGRFDHADLVGVDLAGLDLTRADLTAADLSGASLQGAVLQDACLRRTRLAGADATDLRAHEADLERADATGAVLRNAVLRYAVLLEARLERTDLRDADLRGADLRRADLRRADLRGADLTDADLSGALLTGALVDEIVATRACLSGVRDERSVSLLGLHEAGGYAGLPPLVVQAGQVTGPLGRAAVRAGRAVWRSVARALAPVSTQLAALRQRTRDGLAERAKEAQARKADRDARTEARDAEWARLRAARQAAADAVVAERKARRASQAAVRAARRLLRSGSPDRLVAGAPRPRTLAGLPAAPQSEAAARLAAERARLEPALAAVRAAAAERQASWAERRAAQEAAEQAALREQERQAAEAARAAAEAEAARLAEEERAREEAAQQLEAAEAARRQEALQEAERLAALAREAEALAARREQRQRRQAEALARASADAEAARVAALQARRAEEARLLAEQRDGARGAPEVRPWPRPAEEPLPPPPVAEAPGLLAVTEEAPPELESPELESPELEAPEPPTPTAVPWWRRAWVGRATAPSVPTGSDLDLAGRDLRQQRLGAVAWPQADLRGADLSGARLAGADLTGAQLLDARLESARLQRARLDGAQASGTDWSGVRLRGASLQGVDLRHARLVDADLRGADLTGAQLDGADLTGADLRRSLLQGASLQGATLASARLADLDLAQVNLDEANLDQADLAGVLWSGARVRGADLSGALGLSSRERRALAERGARTGDQGLADLVGGLRSTQVRAALLVFGLGLSAWLGARFFVSSTDPAALAELAASERATDPAAASQSFADLAALSAAPEEQVGYLVEAATLADKAGDSARALDLWQQALAAAGDAPGLSADTAVRLAMRHLEREEWGQAREVARPLLGLDGHPAETRARAVLVWQDATAALQDADPSAVDPEDDPVRTLVDSLSTLPESVADLYLALAELRSARAEPDAAQEALRQAEALSLPLDQRRRIQESRARVLDRAGDLDAAAALYAELAQADDLSAPRADAARLSLADLRQRQGRLPEARTLLAQLTEDSVEEGIRGRALLLTGRLAEQDANAAAATQAYRQVLALRTLDSETRDDARISLARLLSGSGAGVEAAVAGLPPDAAAEILAHAALGEGRRLLDDGRAQDALAVFEEVLDQEDLGETVAFSAQTGRAEALAALGELDDAMAAWRSLLADDPSDAERAEIELQLAQGLLQGNEADEAWAAFRSLAGSAEPDVADRGVLGMAGVARVRGERARAAELYQQVVDEGSDPAYQVQALQELADLATEDGRPEAALASWRALLGVVPPAHPASTVARQAMMLGLADLGRVDEARGVCEQAVATATGVARLRARAACAELAERAGDQDDARARWLQLVDAPDLPEDLAADVILGAARGALAQGDLVQAAALTATGLERVQSTALRLPLLSLRVTALQALAEADPNAAELLAEALEARDALIEEAPALAAPLLVQAAADARGAGDPQRAVGLLERALSLPLSDAERAGALVELGDTLLEAGETADARERFAAVGALDAAGDEATFSAAMGLAEVSRREGDLDGALRTLWGLGPDDASSQRWLLEVRAQVQRDAGDGEGALESWQELLTLAGSDPGARTAALRGAADAHLALDDPEAALPLYEEAARTAPEPAAAGWARLGAALAQAHLGQTDAAVASLAALEAHVDPEVALQARLQQARIYAETERWDAVLGAVDGADAVALGPGWDASIVEARAAALAALDRMEAASAEWEALVSRWPNTEEAVLPAWLGLAEVARQEGDLAAARTWARRALDAASDPAYRDQAQSLVASLDEG